MTQIIFGGIIVFLCALAVFDLVVGVSNDAVNFINSAVGAKAARFKTIIAVAAIGVFAGAALSNGMMDVARHGIFSPQYFSFYEVICIFLAVMVTDVILLDIFNSLGMPTSTTVSLVFEMLGGAFAMSVIKMAKGEGPGLGELLNTDKALSVIAAIFLSVAVAFITGMLVMWISRLVFTFVKPRNGSLKTILFGGVCATSIIWFLLINGLKGSAFMTPDVKEFINANTWMILAACFGAMTVVMAILALFKVNILRTIVLMGTFALAMAFAGNDLVNFVGVPLTGLDAYLDYTANGNGNPDTFMMSSLQESAHTPIVFLLASGAIMVLTLFFSKKAQNVVKTSVDLSRQDEGDEMFGSSSVARRLVHTSLRISVFLESLVPAKIKRAVGKRFDVQEIALEDGAAFDMVRASVNLVLAGLLVAVGTSHKLPLSTTYVTFMVAMGASLADKAWTRDSAVFRITGVLSVIGGWFITAGVAFIICFCVANAMFFGRYVVMVLFIGIAVYTLWSSQKRFAEKKKQEADELYDKMLRSSSDEEIWSLLCEHIRIGNAGHVDFVVKALKQSTEGFLQEDYGSVRKLDGLINEQRKSLKRQRKREVVSMRRLDAKKILPLNTWYFLSINSCKQMLYCMKRINDPVMEHVGNSFSPVPKEYQLPFLSERDKVLNLYLKASKALRESDYDKMDILRGECTALENNISDDCRIALEGAQENGINLDTLMLTVHILQELEQLTSHLSQMLRGMNQFEAAK
ncbi:MAG: inorganic phosphate transporter [Bacteroidales bacterium]|nr:inorganic phosphate transporter [Bacteroidales bacterium]